MQAIDTNVLVRLLTGDDAKQAKAAEGFVANAGGAWVSHLVLAETVWVLDAVYERSRAQLIAALDTLVDHTLFSLQEPEVVIAALQHFKKHERVGFSDCLVLEVARKAGHLPLGTFDMGLGRIDGAKRL